jgi:O-acetylserine/cysteine efflux transporter
VKPIHNLAALVVVLIWGGNFPMVKVTVAEMPPLYLSALRMALTALIVVPFVPMPRGRMGAVAALSVVMGTFHYGLFFIAFKQVDAAVAAIVMQTGAPFSALLAWTMLGDRFGWLRWAGVGIAVLGVAIIAGEPRTASSLPHLALLVAAAFAWALGNIQAKRLGAVNVFTLMGYLALFATPQLFVASWLFESGQWQATLDAGWHVWGGMAYMVLGASLIGYGIWYRLLATYEVSRIVPFSLLAPVVGMIGGMVLLEEAASWQKLVGGAITLVGVALVQSSRHIPSKVEDAVT